MTRRITLSLAFLTLSMSVRAGQKPDAATEPLVRRVALEPSTTGPLSMTFPENVSLQEVFQEWGQRAGITVLFDEAFRDQTLAVDMGNVSAEEALEKLTLVNRLFYKILDAKTVIIAPDNAQKHRQYDDLLLHTFYVAHGDVNGIANMFRTIAGIQRVQPDLTQRSVTVRTSADQLLVAQSILRRNDKPPAELSFVVEVLALDPVPDRAPGLALTADEFLRFKSENDAEVLFSQTIRLTENERATLAVEEGSRQPVTNPTPPEEPTAPRTEESQPDDPPERRAVGIALGLHPQGAPEGDIRLSLTIRARARAGNGTGGESKSAPVRGRDLTTTVSLKDAETTLVQAMFRLDEFGGALDPGLQAERSQRGVVVAITASVVRAPAASEVLTPLPMGTEQQVRIPRH